MTEFALYFRLGFNHITDVAGYDHILFVAVLAVSYEPTAIKRLVLLVTAFTLGHSVTLALATLDRVSVSSQLIETLIPVTILVGAIQAAWGQRATTRVGQAKGTDLPDTIAGIASGNSRLDAHDFARFTLAAVFGLIHGLGFSSFLRMLLGGEESLVGPLLAFNVGLESGQLLILGAVLMSGAVAQRVLRLSRNSWVLAVALFTGIAALQLLMQRLNAAT